MKFRITFLTILSFTLLTLAYIAIGNDLVYNLKHMWLWFDAWSSHGIGLLLTTAVIFAFAISGATQGEK
jgi:amino acid permease